MTTDISELVQSLKAAAENATPGEWCSDDQYGIVADAGLNGNYYIASCSGPEHRSNKRFIALANPANVLVLVEALEKAQQRNAELQGCLEQMIQAHKSTLRTGYERITDLGGDCDSPEAMIAGNPDILHAEKVIAAGIKVAE